MVKKIKKRAKGYNVFSLDQFRNKGYGSGISDRVTAHIEWICKNITKESTFQDLPDDLVMMEDGPDRGMVAMYLAAWLKRVETSNPQIQISENEIDSGTATIYKNLALENLHRAGALIFPAGYFPLVKLLDPEFTFPIEMNKEHPLYKEMDAMSPAAREDFMKYQEALAKQEIDRAWKEEDK